VVIGQMMVQLLPMLLN